MSPLEEARRWMEQQEPTATLLHEEEEAIRGLVGNPGFAALLRWLGSERQGSYVYLSKLNLADSAQLRLATVTQGKIEGIERIREAVLELFASDDPTVKD